MRAWRVLGDSPTESRFEALHGTELTPIIGHEHEIGLLMERFELAKEGEGQVVLLSGEPGIGKSRMIGALRERLGNEAAVSPMSSTGSSANPKPQQTKYATSPAFSRAAHNRGAEPAALDHPQKIPPALSASSQAATQVANPRMPDQIKAAPGSLGTSSSAKPLRTQPRIRRIEPAPIQAA
jgi:hypothetical protein